MGASGASLPFHDNQGHFPVQATCVKICFKSAGSASFSEGAAVVLLFIALLSFVSILDETLLNVLVVLAGFFSEEETSSVFVRMTVGEEDACCAGATAADILLLVSRTKASSFNLRDFA
jgi:hypothetical protein